MNLGEMIVRSRLKELVAQVERKHGTVQQREIAKETKLTENTISRWMKPDPFSRIESHAALELCKYLSRKLERSVELGDLLYIDYIQF